jgi:hypothetical protein
MYIFFNLLSFEVGFCKLVRKLGELVEEVSTLLLSGFVLLG